MQLLAAPLFLVSAVLGLVEQFLFLLIRAYDVLVYSPLQKVTTPFVRLVPRSITIGGKRITIFNANIVTYARTLLVLPIAFCLRNHWNHEAFYFVLFHDYLDHLDGIVAKAHKAMGYQEDDPLFGSFLDAFADKVVNVSCLWSVVLLARYSHMSNGELLLFLGVIALIVSYELALGWVRLEDYFYCKFCPNPAQRNLAASMAGKLKEKLESLGLAFLCLSLSHPISPMQHWGGQAGVVCLLLTIRLAHSSLTHKLSAH